MPPKKTKRPRDEEEDGDEGGEEEEGEGGHSVGALVEADFNGKWSPAVVSARYSNGTYDVEWDSDTETLGLAAGSVRALRGKPPAKRPKSARKPAGKPAKPAPKQQKPKAAAKKAKRADEDGEEEGTASKTRPRHKPPASGLDLFRSEARRRSSPGAPVQLSELRAEYEGKPAAERKAYDDRVAAMAKQYEEALAKWNATKTAQGSAKTQPASAKKQPPAEKTLPKKKPGEKPAAPAKKSAAEKRAKPSPKKEGEKPKAAAKKKALTEKQAETVILLQDVLYDLEDVLRTATTEVSAEGKHVLKKAAAVAKRVPALDEFNPLESDFATVHSKLAQAESRLRGTHTLSDLLLTTPVPTKKVPTASLLWKDDHIEELKAKLPSAGAHDLRKLATETFAKEPAEVRDAYVERRNAAAAEKRAEALRARKVRNLPRPAVDAVERLAADVQELILPSKAAAPAGNPAANTAPPDLIRRLNEVLTTIHAVKLPPPARTDGNDDSDDEHDEQPSPLIPIPDTCTLQELNTTVQGIAGAVVKGLFREPLTTQARRQAKAQAAKKKEELQRGLIALRGEIFKKFYAKPGEDDVKMVEAAAARLPKAHKDKVMAAFVDGETWDAVLYEIRDILDACDGERPQRRRHPTKGAFTTLTLALPAQPAGKKKKLAAPAASAGPPLESAASLPPLPPPTRFVLRKHTPFDRALFGDMVFCWYFLYVSAQVVKVTRFPLHQFIEAITMPRSNILIETVFTQLLCLIEEAEKADAKMWTTHVLSVVANEVGYDESEDEDDESEEDEDEDENDEEEESGSDEESGDSSEESSSAESSDESGSGEEGEENEENEEGEEEEEESTPHQQPTPTQPSLALREPIQQRSPGDPKIPVSQTNLNSHKNKTNRRRSDTTRVKTKTTRAKKTKTKMRTTRKKRAGATKKVATRAKSQAARKAATRAAAARNPKKEAPRAAAARKEKKMKKTKKAKKTKKKKKKKKRKKKKAPKTA
ncbi:hypothetical protein DIPPA_28463 [Diplonema papillatum]|nr:hypothetical protein DIPPA_28463 [Diplonema papillatum]